MRNSKFSTRRLASILVTAALVGGSVGALAAPAYAAGPGTIQGVVTGVGGAPLNNVHVQVFVCDPAQEYPDCWKLLFEHNTFTNASGAYSIPNLEYGDYRLVASPQTNNAQYAYEYFDGAQEIGDGTTLTLDAAHPVVIANPTLEVGATIAGHVDDVNNNPAAGVTVGVSRTSALYATSTVVTDSNGNYSLGGLRPGEYIASARPTAGSPLVQEYWNNQPDAASATRFTLTSATTFTADFELAAGAVVSGTVTGPSNAALEDIQVTVYKLDAADYWRQAFQTTTDGSGDYSVQGLDPGEYVVRFSDVGGTYGQRYWDGESDRVSATRLTLDLGDTESGIDATLVPGGTVAGTVTQTAGGATVPSNGGFVEVFIRDAAGDWESVGSKQTDANGNYSLSGLAPGTYTVQTYGAGPAPGGLDWAGRYHGGAYYPADATGVAVAGTATTGGVNVNVVPGVTISGAVFNEGSSPAPGVLLKILLEREPGVWAAPPPHGGHGDEIGYLARAMPPGKYKVCFVDNSGSATPFVTQCWQDKPTEGSATILNGTNGGKFTDITAHMTHTPWPVLTASATPSPSAPNGTNGWYTSNVSVALAASGGTVVADKLEYKLGSGSWTTYASPITISASGTSIVQYRGSEQELPAGPEGQLTIKLDKGLPTVSGSLTNRTVTVTATDAVSGVASVQYRLGTSGTWSPYTAPVVVGNGPATVQFRATDQAGNVSAVGSTDVPAATTLPEPDRISGGDRFDTATDVSEASYPDGADIVYVTTGMVFPDALSAGPAAAFEGAPLLLVAPTAIPASVTAEIERLDPDKIIVIGGTPSVSEAVFDQLEALVPETSRISGVDRFATSRNVTRAAFEESGADIAYIATGLTFPDALAAGGAAGSRNAPVILVDGAASDLDAATSDLLDDLGVTQVYVLGGTGSVSAGVLSDLKALLGDAKATRIAGTSRYETARLVNLDAFDEATTVFLATGLNFPDALAGSAWAAKEHAPLYVVPPTCIPGAVLDAISGHHPSEIVLLGGEPSLSAAVADLTPCS